MILQVGIVRTKIRVGLDNSLIPQVRQQVIRQTKEQFKEDLCTVQVMVDVDGTDWSLSPTGELQFKGKPTDLSSEVSTDENGKAVAIIHGEARYKGLITE